MNRCDICKSSTELYNHRDIKLCRGCALERGWKSCNHCHELQHPDVIHSLEGMSICAICWCKDQRDCDLCGNCYPSWFMRNGCRHEYGVVMCRSCDRDSTFTRKTTHVCDSYVEVPSNRYFGIELETHKCPNYRQLFDGKCWGAKYDDTVEGIEFDSPKFRGDCGFEAVTAICDVAENNSWEVNSSCGFHLHLDLSKECAKNLRAIAYAYNSTVSVWRELVTDNRKLSTWCTHDCDEIEIKYLKNKEDWRLYAMNEAHRHIWVNWSAYYDYGTVEIRSHEGTLDKDVICNWVKAHMVFIDWAIKTGEIKVLDTLKGTKRELFSILAGIWSEAGQGNLTRFYAKKSNLMLEDLVI